MVVRGHKNKPNGIIDDNNNIKRNEQQQTSARNLANVQLPNILRTGSLSSGNATDRSNSFSSSSSSGILIDASCSNSLSNLEPLEADAETTNQSSETLYQVSQANGDDDKLKPQDWRAGHQEPSTSSSSASSVISTTESLQFSSSIQSNSSPPPLLASSLQAFPNAKKRRKRKQKRTYLCSRKYSHLRRKIQTMLSDGENVPESHPMV